MYAVNSMEGKRREMCSPVTQRKKAKKIIYACCLFGSSLGFPFGAQQIKMFEPLNLLKTHLRLETFEDCAPVLTRTVVSQLKLDN